MDSNPTGNLSNDAEHDSGLSDSLRVAEAFGFVGAVVYAAGGCGGRRLYRFERYLVDRKIQTWTKRNSLVKRKRMARSMPFKDIQWTPAHRTVNVTVKPGEPTHHDVVIKYLTERVSESEMPFFKAYLENPDSDGGLAWRKERNRRKRERRRRGWK